MNNTKKIALLILTLVTFSAITTHAGRGWGGGGSFAVGALTGVAVGSIAANASRPQYGDDTYGSRSKCRKAVRELENEIDELQDEIRQLKRENKQLRQQLAE